MPLLLQRGGQGPYLYARLSTPGVTALRIGAVHEAEDGWELYIVLLKVIVAIGWDYRKNVVSLARILPEEGS